MIFFVLFAECKSLKISVINIQSQRKKERNLIGQSTILS